MAGKKSSGGRKGGLRNFGSKRAVPFGRKGGGSVPKGGYTPRSATTPRKSS